MKVMQAFLLLNAVAAAVVAAGMQIAVDDFANVPILKLDLIAEVDALLRSIRLEDLISEIPFEDDGRSLRRRRHCNVERHVVGIAVQHPVGKDPKVICT